MSSKNRWNEEICDKGATLIKEYYSWVDFVKGIQSGKIGNNFNIYRGHSNFEQSDSVIWDIQSAFNRINAKSNFLKNNYSVYNNVRKYLKLYKTGFTQEISELTSFIDILQVFQHYSVPTPLVDFTSDPLVALYFSLASIPSYSEGKIGDRKNRWITIIEINIEGLLSIIHPDTDVITLLYKCPPQDKEEYEESFKTLQKKYSKSIIDRGFVFDLMLEPNIKINPNLFRQKGIFIYLDSDKSLETIVYDEIISKRKNIKHPIFIKHLIPYSSLYVNEKNNCLNIYSYLQFKQRTGIYLFENDVQGLKYDLLNGNFTYPMDCLGKFQSCECREFLVNNGIIV